MIDLNKLLEDLTDEDIIKIVLSLGGTNYIDAGNAIIFQTICHNEASEDASMKLYYYKENKKFHCYTDCASNFNLYKLIEKVWILQGGNLVANKELKKSKKDFCFFDTVRYVMDSSNIVVDFNENKKERYVSERQKYQRKQRAIELQTFVDSILEIFEDVCPVEWLNEGITPEAMKHYGIRYSISRNKIVIPHFNVNHQLIGIRGRALNQDEIDTFGKYMPLEIENKWYAHPLSQNLYGLNFAKVNIQKKRKVIIFEGEKSCLHYYGFFGRENNISVACCGSSINKAQINLLLRTCMPDEIIVAFDKEYENANGEDGEKYFNKLYSMCEKYKNYAKFSFIFDRDNLLDLKDSPVDKGLENFKKLYESRVIVK